MTDAPEQKSQQGGKHKRTAAMIEGWRRDAWCGILFSCYHDDQEFMAKARRIINRHRLAIVRLAQTGPGRMRADWTSVVVAPDALRFMVDDLRKTGLPADEIAAKERDWNSLADVTSVLVAEFQELAKEYGLDGISEDRGLRELYQFAEAVCIGGETAEQITFGGRVYHMHEMPINPGSQDGRGFPVRVEVRAWWLPYRDAPEEFVKTLIDECLRQVKEQLADPIRIVETAGITFPYAKTKANEHIGWLYWRLIGYSPEAIATALAEIARRKKSTEKAPKKRTETVPKWRQVQAATKNIADVIDVSIPRSRFDSLPIERFTGFDK